MLNGQYIWNFNNLNLKSNLIYKLPLDLNKQIIKIHMIFVPHPKNRDMAQTDMINIKKVDKHISATIVIRQKLIA